jgi:chaperonin GroEL
MKVRESKETNFGFNAATEAYADMISSGILDPAKVARTALQDAASIAALMLTPEALISEIPGVGKVTAMPGGETM